MVSVHAFSAWELRFQLVPCNDPHSAEYSAYAYAKRLVDAPEKCDF